MQLLECSQVLWRFQQIQCHMLCVCVCVCVCGRERENECVVVERKCI